eukprot:413722_1
MSVVKPNINELLINGFVRSIQSNLIHFKIIPVDVIHLCILFYSIQIRILISTNTHTLQNNDFMIAEFATKMITKLNIQKDIHKYGALFGCYIPKISSMIQCHPKNKTFDAILPFSRLSLHDNSNMDNCILLLESEKICVTDIVTPKLFVSKNKVTNLIHAKTIFCGKKHGIIYVDKHGLNQLKLENIKLNHNDHTFDFKNEEIQSNINEIFKLPGNYNSRRQMRQSEHYLSMRYLSNYNKIFAMQCYNDSGFPMLKHSPKMLSKESICGMFDFSNNKWIQIPNFKYKISENGLRSVYYLICQSPIKMADIFVLSNLNKTAKYDCNKHQWITYYDVESSFQKMDYYDLWFDIDPFVLYRCCKGCWKYNDVKFQYFDTRTRMKNVGWKELDATFITSGFASEKYTKIKTFIATNEYL